MNAATQQETLVLDMELAPKADQPLVAQPAEQPMAVALNSPAGMMMQARQMGYSAAEISQMMDLQDRFEKREAEKAYNVAFASFKAEAIEIIKRKQVHFETRTGVTSYKHAELSDVVDAVTPALSRHGLSASWKVTEQRSDWIQVTCYLKHALGHFETATLGGPPDQSGGKNAIQAFISAKTYLERQTMKAVCGVAEKGEDDDGRGGPTPTPKADPFLDAFQAAAMLGDKALRQHYAKNTPTDEFWRMHSVSLKAAARKADAEGAPR